VNAGRRYHQGTNPSIYRTLDQRRFLDDEIAECQDAMIKEELFCPVRQEVFTGVQKNLQQLIQNSSIVKYGREVRKVAGYYYSQVEKLTNCAQSILSFGTLFVNKRGKRRNNEEGTY
jgi:hypothetical protein